MSDKTLSGDELEDLLLSWQKKYGREQKNKVGNIYYKIDDMRTAFNALVNTFISIGYTHKDLKSALLSNQIQRSLTPHRYEGKLAQWRLMIEKQWKNAINDRFPIEIKEAVVLEEAPKPSVILPAVENISPAGVITRADGTTYKERPLLKDSIDDTAKSNVNFTKAEADNQIDDIDKLNVIIKKAESKDRTFWKSILSHAKTKKSLSAKQQALVDQKYIELGGGKILPNGDVISAAGVITRADGTTYKERPLLKDSDIKGLVKPEYILVDNDPLAFLKKGKK